MSEKVQVKKLNIREQIRLRPGMFIGSVDKGGMHNIIIGVLRILCEQNNTKTEIVLDLSNEITVLKFRGTIINQLVISDAEKALKSFIGLEQNLLDFNESYLICALFHLTSHMKVSANQDDLIVLNEDKFNYSCSLIGKEDWLYFHFKLGEEFFKDHIFSKSILRDECEKLAALNKNVHIELLDNRNGSCYHEKFTMMGGLIQLFDNTLDLLESRNFDSYRGTSASPKFHISIKEPDLSLELIFMISNLEDTFEYSYYRFINLTEGGSHISYFKMRLEQLNEQLNNEFESYNNDLKSYNLITNIETEQPFPFAGPTKTRIEDPILVQIMKSAFDQLEPEIIAFYQAKSSNDSK